VTVATAWVGTTSFALDFQTLRGGTPTCTARTAVADAWLSEELGNGRPKRAPGAAVGFGVEEVVLSQLLFPIVSAAGVVPRIFRIMVDGGKRRRRGQ
jgi:hypothetical protein